MVAVIRCLFQFRKSLSIPWLLYYPVDIHDERLTDMHCRVEKHSCPWAWLFHARSKLAKPTEQVSIGSLTSLAKHSRPCASTSPLQSFFLPALTIFLLSVYFPSSIFHPFCQSWGIQHSFDWRTQAHFCAACCVDHSFTLVSTPDSP